jgi:hypothetical protein
MVLSLLVGLERGAVKNNTGRSGFAESKPTPIR